MALLKDNQYYRIVKTAKNLINKTMDVEFYIYRNEEERLIEKELEPQLASFLTNAKDKLNKDYLILQNKLFALQKEAEETGVPYHELLYNAETLKTEFNEYNAMAAEYAVIRDNALINVVDNLTFIELWKELGFTESFANTPIEKQRIQYTIDIFTDDLTEIYNYIKTNILINTEDC